MCFTLSFLATIKNRHCRHARPISRILPSVARTSKQNYNNCNVKTTAVPGLPKAEHPKKHHGLQTNGWNRQLTGLYPRHASSSNPFDMRCEWQRPPGCLPPFAVEHADRNRAGVDTCQRAHLLKSIPADGQLRATSCGIFTLLHCDPS